MKKILVILALCFSSSAAMAGVDIVLSVDWEGQDLRPDNLAKMEQFRQSYPGVPLMHYLNAAYFTKPGAQANEIGQIMRAAVLPGDSTGVHLHGWVRLFQAAGVRPRFAPLWSGSAQNFAACQYDCGHEVPISSYTAGELQNVLQLSQQLLAAQGFSELRDFRAGGWMSTAAVKQALCATGFRSDSSQVPVNLLVEELASFPLLTSLKNIWGTVPVTVQPTRTACRTAGLWQVPNNGGLADYTDANEMMAVVQSNRLESERTGNRQVVVLGFHQESAVYYLDRIERFLDMLKAAQAVGQLTDVRIVSFPQIWAQNF